jgi:serine/threonine protein kinase
MAAAGKGLALNLVGGKFEISSRQLGEGSFGVIYYAKNVKTGEEVAAKFEPRKDTKEHSQLKRETKIYYKLDGEGRT